jgi:nucleoside-diphosphate kinase
MAGEITFTMIKPVAFQNNVSGKIIDRIQSAGFWLVAAKTIHLSQLQAETFYAVHKDRPFFKDLVTFMSSAPIMVAILQKENAVEDYRKFIGKTNPAEAEPGTIRRDFGTSIQANAVHGSDSDENAIIECDFFFSKSERFYKEG